ncbi:unnamed protein product [Cuscuta campestris]|uniref:Endonuclease/exonuclease/phosphatase domain-containing protein n=1 Tax=Cuscuta campestris TaxID=132261 RepID=A0A484N0F6_9ASTE|nr:unnamed protein product [Cuscuta campestris]
MTDPWCCLGDFNTILRVEDRKGGIPVTEEEIMDFRECVMECGLEEIPSVGPYYTWSNRQQAESRIFSKLDRVLANVEWMMKIRFKTRELNEGISDHTPLLVTRIARQGGGKPFRFCDIWMNDPTFKSILEHIWSDDRKNKGVEEIREELMETQNKIQVGISQYLVNKERDLLDKLHKAIRASYLMKCQQSKQEWMTEGDKNSNMFHAWLKKRMVNNQILEIQDESGKSVEGIEEIARVFEDFYKKLLGTKVNTEGIEEDIMKRGKCLNIEQQLGLLKTFIPQQVKEAIFSIPNKKSPGPDGFSSGFFKNQWKEVGELFTRAVLDFFKEGRTLQQINSTAITIIPKRPDPISCCSTAKEMWDKLEVTYEGTDQVREAKIDFLTQEYEMFRMKEHEKIDDMFDRFSKIVNDLHALKKTYTDRDLVRKILRSLTSEWRSKADAIYESIGTSNVTIDSL